MEISLVFHSHPAEETLEKYAFGRLDEQQVESLEEHLLGCESCQASLEETIEHIKLMKEGLAAGEFAKAKKAASNLAVRGGLVEGSRCMLSTAGRPRINAWATAIAAGCIIASIAAHAPSRVAAPLAAEVILDSVRGGDFNPARAPARRTLDLRIDAGNFAVDFPEKAPTALAYRLDVVSTSGKPIWNGTPELSSGMLSVHIPGGLAAGMYWVRLYTSQSEILSEFGLLLE